MVLSPSAGKIIPIYGYVLLRKSYDKMSASTLPLGFLALSPPDKETYLACAFVAPQYGVWGAVPYG